MASNILGSLLLLIKTKGDTSGLDKTDKAIKKTTTSLQKMSKSTGMLSGLSNKLFGGISAGNLVNKFNQFARSYVQFEQDVGAMKSRFFAITNDEAKAMEEFDYIRQLATDTASDIKSTADAYSIFYATARKPLGQENARELFEQWTKVARVLHLSEEQFGRVTYALREMSNKGQLYAQDLNMQIGGVVPNAKALALEAIKSLNLPNINSVEDFQKATKRDSTLMPKFLMAFSRRVGTEYASPEALAKALEQPDALLKHMRNIVQNFFFEFSKAGGLKSLATILMSIKDIVNNIDYKGLANTLNVVSNSLANGISFISSHLKLIVFLLQTIIAYKIATKIGEISKFISNIAINKFASRALLAGSKGPFISALTAGFLKGGGKLGLKVMATRLLGFLGGPWGLFISTIITFIPQILGFVRKLWEYTPWGKNDKNKLPEGMLTETISVQQALNTAKRLQNMGIDTPEQLRAELVKTTEGRELMSYLNINDNKHITIYVDGSDKSVADIAEEIKSKINKTDTIYGSKPQLSKENIEWLKDRGIYSGK